MGVLVAATLQALTVGTARADTVPSTVSPVIQRPAANVTADALSTEQIDNGVVWALAMSGNTVYAGGQFSNVRPPGSQPGTNLTPRGNLMAFDVTTGALVSSFAPNLNSTVKTLTTSPDGKVLYVGGSFTTANGATRSKIAAYDLTTGSLLSTFAPSPNLTVNAIYATATTVYIAGDFTQVNGQNRAHFAALNASDGSLTAWAPTADATVQALVMSPDGSRLIAGGAFTTVNGGSAYGLAALDPVNGTLYPWAANQVVQDAGANASILSLTTDGSYVYGTGYVYGTSGNFEGTFAADPVSGNVHWLADCHGDTYGAFGVNNIVYTISHYHYCSNIGGFPDTNPRSVWHRTTAFTQAATGTVLPNGQTGGGYGNFGGYPSPSLIDWMPDLVPGTFTGTDQAAWSVTGNTKYVVEGGEFPSVNSGAPQYGLVRFGVPSVATNQQGPMLYGSAITPTVVARSATSARVTWPANWDRDDMNLVYTVRRSDKGSTPVYSATLPSESWNLPTFGWIDTGLTPGGTYSYTVRATDPSSGKYQGSASVSVTLPLTSPTDSTYTKDVLADGAVDYWKLDQAAGATTNIDYAGYYDQTLTSVTAGASGAINGDSDTASTFAGTSSSFASTATAVPGPNTFSEEAWFATTTTAGGKIVGFGDKATGTSSNYDRHIYMDTSGRINFGVYNNASYVVTSAKAYNDGLYHHVVGTLSSAGLALYVDGVLVGTNTGTTIGQPYNGYWRIGGDSSWSGSNFFAGKIDEVAIYPTALTLSQVRQHFIDSGRTAPGFTAPSDTYGATVWRLSPSVYYRLDEASGSIANDISGSNLSGTYYGGVVKNVASPVAGGDPAATFDGSTGTVSPNTAVTAPTTYTEQAWFKTTSTLGGKILGFGDAKKGSSSNYDRHVYMLADGRLVFGTYTGGLNLATSTAAYNDGKWHFVAATQSSNGMTLYVDGQSVATNPQTAAQSYSGYWRIGGDNLNGWNANNAFFSGTIDEPAFWNSTALTASQISNEYYASPASPAPTAQFTATATNLSVSTDASASSVGGAGVTYSWTFGDGTSAVTATTPTASHTYSSAGTYTIGLTVTDGLGRTATATKSVSVTAPKVPPTAAFTASVANLSVAFDATGSSAQSGATITGYAWDFGDGSAGTGAKPTHVYGAGGTYAVKLTVTDSNGLTSSVTHNVTTTAPNKPPVATFTSSTTNLSVAFDATGSSDPDGTIASYAWDFGDGAHGTGATPTHVYSAAGTYTVVLTVTDNAGATGTYTDQVTPTKAPNQPPVAAFTASVNHLTVAFDASGSSDPDGTVASYAWDFGDGTTGTGVTVSHDFASARSYSVTLTVTDDQGATNSVTQTVTTTPAGSIAADTFSRSVTNGWGTADVGGAWTLTGASSIFGVDGSAGTMSLAPGVVGVASLNSVSTTDLNAVADVSINAEPLNNGVALTMIARQVGKTNYQLKVRLLPGNVVHLVLSKVVSGTETIFKEVNVTGLNYATGDTLRFRFQAIGTGTTALSGKVWKVGTAEPTAAQITQSDTTAALQAAGSFALQSYLSSSSTNAMTVKWDNLAVNAS